MAASKGEIEAMVVEIAATLRTVERYCEQDFLNRFSGFHPREVRVAVHEAREQVRETDGIVFGATPGWPGNFRRLDWKQVAEQATRQRAAGTRKHRRAGEKLRLAATKAPDADRERLSAAADRVALRLAMRAAKG